MSFLVRGTGSVHVADAGDAAKGPSSSHQSNGSRDTSQDPSAPVRTAQGGDDTPLPAPRTAVPDPGPKTAVNPAPEPTTPVDPVPGGPNGDDVDVKAPEEPALPSPQPSSAPLFAKIETISGSASVTRAGVIQPAIAGLEIGVGDEFAVEDGTVGLRSPDGTHVKVGSYSALVAEVGGRSIRLRRGSFTAEVTKQPAGMPLHFVTADSDVEVLGTVLRIDAQPGSSRIDLLEGMVVVTRLADGKTVELVSGEFVVVGPPGLLTAKPLYGRNLIADPGFERGGFGWAPVDLSDSTVRQGEAHSGSSALWIKAPTAPPGFHGLNKKKYDNRLVATFVPVSAGTTYEVAGWARTVKPAGQGAWIIVNWIAHPLLDTMGTNPATQEAFLAGYGIKQTEKKFQVGEAETWTTFTHSVEAPPGARTVKITLFFDNDARAQAEAWFDDLSFREVR